MSGAPPEVLRWGRERARLSQWRSDRGVALLTPVPGAPAPSAEFVRRCLDVLAARGYERVVTGALSPLEQAGFLAAGFEVAERLRLLALDLAAPLPPVSTGGRLRRARAGDRAQVLAVDAAAFDPFWRFDDAGLSDALSATARSRWRVAVGERPGRPVTGYAISGRADGTGFVQRLAVAPEAQHRGTGRRLLVDGLTWMRRHGARRALVNTQIGNDRALGLYLDVGFREDPAGLSVLGASLIGGRAAGGSPS